MLGTGKSFIGALIAKIIHDHTSETILVQTYTNHALDQFLEDLQSVGIPARSIVRLGHRSSNVNTKALGLSVQQSTYKMSPTTYSMKQQQISKAEGYHDALMNKVHEFETFQTTDHALLDYLEFSEDSEFFDAFTVPDMNEGMSMVGAKGKSVDALYLLQRWKTGKNAGVFQRNAQASYPTIWNKSLEQRKCCMNKWIRDILKEYVSDIGHLMQKYNERQDHLQQLYREKDAHIIGTKRIIGCTTTAAANYTAALHKVSPGVVLVEEAGEILESHILTAMTLDTKQLVLIGDHKQLRPKVNNYTLTVEKGDGYNLNQSLFERLVLSDVPHTTLDQQHRMRPEISSLVRNMTYPELKDAPKTKDRPQLRGFQDNIIFVAHGHLELNGARIADRRDEGAKSSKENQYEADILLKCVRYLGQQGYGTDQLVILTPYLGQLYLLLRTLAKENDPILNDLDSHELTRAGLLPKASANVSKRPIKISTIGM